MFVLKLAGLLIIVLILRAIPSGEDEKTENCLDREVENGKLLIGVEDANRVVLLKWATYYPSEEMQLNPNNSINWIGATSGSILPSKDKFLETSDELADVGCAICFNPKTLCTQPLYPSGEFYYASLENDDFVIVRIFAPNTQPRPFSLIAKYNEKSYTFESVNTVAAAKLMLGGRIGLGADTHEAADYLVALSDCFSISAKDKRESDAALITSFNLVSHMLERYYESRTRYPAKIEELLYPDGIVERMPLNPYELSISIVDVPTDSLIPYVVYFPYIPKDSTTPQGYWLGMRAPGQSVEPKTPLPKGTTLDGVVGWIEVMPGYN